MMKVYHPNMKRNDEHTEQPAEPIFPHGYEYGREGIRYRRQPRLASCPSGWLTLCLRDIARVAPWQCLGIVSSMSR
jgi:hypothetical protein